MKVNDCIAFDFHHNVESRKTSCVVTVKDKQFVGVAICNPKDQFSRMEGRKHSIARAMKKVLASNAMNKQERAQVWNKYLSSCKIK